MNTFSTGAWTRLDSSLQTDIGGPLSTQMLRPISDRAMDVRDLEPSPTIELPYAFLLQASSTCSLSTLLVPSPLSVVVIASS